MTTLKRKLTYADFQKLTIPFAIPGSVTDLIFYGVQKLIRQAVFVQSF